MLPQEFFLKNCCKPKKEPWYPIKPQPSYMYNGQLSTTDRISFRKVAVMEKFDCYSNDDTFIVAINFFFVG